MAQSLTNLKKVIPPALFRQTKNDKRLISHLSNYKEFLDDA